MMTDQLSLTFSALADPTRRAILARLSRGEASVSQLCEPFEITMPAISRHLKVLEQAGLVTRGKNAQYRPVALEAAPLRDIAGWVEEYRKFWDKSFDRMDAYLREIQKGDPNGSRN